MKTIEYDFSVRLYRDNMNQYMVNMIEINQKTGKPKIIPFVFDSGATYTSLNKDLAEEQSWDIFATGVELGSYLKDAPPTIYDLRKIPKLVFGIRQVVDLVVATPVDGTIKVANLLGRNFIDNFAHGIEPDLGKVYFRQRSVAVNSNFSFGQISHTTLTQPTQKPLSEDAQKLLCVVRETGFVERIEKDTGTSFRVGITDIDAAIKELVSHKLLVTDEYTEIYRIK